MWTSKEIETLKNRYSLEKSINIALVLNNKTVQAIVSKANRLGLKKEVGSGRQGLGKERILCARCGKDLGLVRISRKRKFCSHSCAGEVNTKGRSLSDDHKRKISIANKGRYIKPMSLENKEVMRKIIQKIYANGWMPKAGRCKKIKYISPIAGEVLLDGTWELAMAQWMDKSKLSWARNKKRFEYVKLDGKIGHYTPDFFVKEFDGYLEVKGYETELDRCKWSQFKAKLLVFRKGEIAIIKNGEVPKPVKGLVC